MGGAGTDQALETADIVLMGDDLLKLPFAIRLSRQTLGVLRQNIAFSLLVKAVFMVLVLAGTATLWMAVFADVGTSLIVIANGMRLLREKIGNLVPQRPGQGERLIEHLSVFVGAKHSRARRG